MKKSKKILYLINFKENGSMELKDRNNMNIDNNCNMDKNV